VTRPGRRVSIVGRLGVFPAAHLSLPSRRLFAYLALHHQEVSRGIAAAALWTDLPESQGRTNLRRALWQSPPGWINASGDELELCATVDVQHARATALRALEGGHLTFAEIELLSEDILPGWYEDWVIPAQDAFHLLRVQALEAACVTMTEAGLYALATQAGTAALAGDPLRESAVAALIAAHLREGNRYAASRRFTDFERTLNVELGVRPSPALRAAVDGLGARRPTVT
jgi:DNA-binding SARP family transcriptional activator